jgi:hypothetical protein
LSFPLSFRFVVLSLFPLSVPPLCSLIVSLDFLPILFLSFFLI